MSPSQSVVLTFLLRPDNRLSLVQPGAGCEIAVIPTPPLQLFAQAMRAVSGASARRNAGGALWWRQRWL